jgi:hypothetical protein
MSSRVLPIVEGAQSVAGLGAVSGSAVTKRAAFEMLLGRRSKRECPASIFIGVKPFWKGDRIMYRFRLKHKDFGRCSDENVAALARDYAARRLAALSHTGVRQVSSSQFLLEDVDEMQRIDAWIHETFFALDRREKSSAVEVVSAAEGGMEFRVRFRIDKQLIHFGTFSSERMAKRVADYVRSGLLSKWPEQGPRKQLTEYAELKMKLDRIYNAVLCQSVVVDDTFAAGRAEFWEAVKDGPVKFVCCSCHHTWFRKSVRCVTEALVSKTSRGACAAAMTDISEWVCLTCIKYLSNGPKVPPVCHLNYDPFQDLPEELQDLSAVENDLIALRLPFMKVRALDPSVRGGPRKFGQLCLSGMVINVPTDLGRIQIELPRRFSADETVLVNVKRKLQYKHYYKSKNVRPGRLYRRFGF